MSRINPSEGVTTTSVAGLASVSAVARFHVYQQTREGTYTPAFRTDSAVEAIGAFLRQMPAFEGGEIRLWDHREQHLSAWVKWVPRSGDLGVHSCSRLNVFQDRLLAVIAGHAEISETIREDVRRGVWLGV
jgi:hypothetical protein